MVVHSALSDAELDRLFRALADSTRRDIVARVLSGEPASVSALAARYDMSFAAVQKHVAVLEGAGLVTKHRRRQMSSHPAILRLVPRGLTKSRSRLIPDQISSTLRRRATMVEFGHSLERPYSTLASAAAAIGVSVLAMAGHSNVAAAAGGAFQQGTRVEGQVPRLL